MASVTSDGVPALNRIAAALGVPVEHFASPKALQRWDGISEGLQLLQGIESETGMRRALDCLRRIAREDDARMSRRTGS